MKFTTKNQSGILVIIIQDERLDAKNASSFKEQVIAAIDKDKAKDAILDLKKMTYIDSSGIGTFLAILRNLNEKGGDLKLANASSPVMTVLKLVSIDKVFEIFPSTEMALKAFYPDVETPMNNR